MTLSSHFTYRMKLRNNSPFLEKKLIANFSPFSNVFNCFKSFSNDS